MCLTVIDTFRPMDSSKLAVIYCRVSSRTQTKRGDGLGSQETICRDYARYRGYTVVACFQDDLSGKLVDRPGMKAMLAYLRQNKRAAHVVIIDDISRLARDIRTHLDLRDAITQHGARLESPTTQFSHTRDLGIEEGMKALFAQELRVKNSEQTRSRRTGRVMNGYWPFHAPVGYRHENVKGLAGQLMVRDEPVASVVQAALEGYASGRFQTQAEVKRYLEAQPEFPKPSQGVTNQKVNDLLTKPLYAGMVECPKYGVSLRQGRHEALVSFETYQKIQDRIKGKARVPARKDLNADFPLRGAVVCGDCGTPLTACWSSGTGGRYPYYLCPKRGCTSYGKSIRRSVLEGEFKELLTTLQPTENLVRVATAMFEDLWNHRLANGVERTKALRAELAKVERQEGQLLDRIVEASAPAVVNAYEDRIRKLGEDKVAISEKIANCGRPLKSFDETLRTALDFLGNPQKLWDSERLEDKRVVLKLAFVDQLAYVRNEGFRTANLALPFKVLADFSSSRKKLARPERFELPTFWFVGWWSREPNYLAHHAFLA
jgi:site-specific DNA recombinase